MLRRFGDSQSSALIGFFLILLSGAIWMVRPVSGIWIILVALLPWIGSLVSDRFPIQLAWYDWLLAAFLFTAWVGYWVAYDEAAAWHKVWFLMLGTLLFYSLRAQPRSNLTAVSYSLFGLGVAIALYYLLTHDFTGSPRKLEFVNSMGRAMMSLRPQTAWTPIHPNYAAGIIALTVPFVIYPLWEERKRDGRLPGWHLYLVVAGLCAAAFALLMATSRGVVLALASGAGAVVLAFLLTRSRKAKGAVLFSVLFVYLCSVVLILYLGPAQRTDGVAGNSYFGEGSRAELFSRSVYLLADFPLTGGGLDSFPGLYSRYILSIPFHFLPNSHNLFLDVTIEQGIIGGLAFLCLYGWSLWRVSSRLAAEDRTVFHWILIFSLIAAMVHGMVDNYLYNGAGSMFSLFLVGLALRRPWKEDVFRKRSLKFTGVLAAFLAAGMLAFPSSLRSVWLANLGAVQLSTVELHNFPNSTWDIGYAMSKLEPADTTLQHALRLDADNRTANHRLGLIAMTRGDFPSAVHYLEAARKKAPEHRGIIKSLGYCYVWLGDLDSAQALLDEIPEAKSELEVYIWWWDTQGRSDLSEYARRMAARLKNFRQP